MSTYFRPRLGQTCVAAFLVLILLALGGWQVFRLKWKTNLIALVEGRLSQQEAFLPPFLQKGNEWEYRKVNLEGHYLYSHEYFVGPRVWQGKTGRHLLTPFARENGEVIFINRGWVPDEKGVVIDRPQGKLNLHGYVLMPQKTTFTPDNDPAHQTWYWPDVMAMTKDSELSSNADFIVIAAARSASITSFPVSEQIVLDFPNHHLWYAMFWFFMAGVLTMIWFLSSRIEERER